MLVSLNECFVCVYVCVRVCVRVLYIYACVDVCKSICFVFYLYFFGIDNSLPMHCLTLNA